jgi:D-arabinose 1-dehydrogenase-like Zn-dependent alcohol dehydrogenase
MPATAKAAVFFGPGKPFEIREVPIPEVEPEGVLIRVTHANVCGSDLHFWRGDAPLRLPDDGWIFGHEMTGRVAKLGSKIKTDSLGRPLKEGDRVAYTYFYPCGRCYACLNKEPAACPNKIERPLGPGAFPHLHGAFADHYYLRPGGAIFKVQDGLADEAAAGVNCALSQVMYGLHVAGVRLGDSVVIQGAGGLGVQAAGRQGHGRRDGHRGGPDPRPPRTGEGFRRRPRAELQGRARPHGAREARPPVDGRRGRGCRLRLRRLPGGHP